MTKNQKRKRMIEIIEKAKDLRIEFESDIEETGNPEDEIGKFEMLPGYRFKIYGVVG